MKLRVQYSDHELIVDENTLDQLHDDDIQIITIFEPEGTTRRYSGWDVYYLKPLEIKLIVGVTKIDDPEDPHFDLGRLHTHFYDGQYVRSEDYEPRAQIESNFTNDSYQLMGKLASQEVCERLGIL